MAPIPLTKEQLALIETANTTIRVFPQSKTLQITDRKHFSTNIQNLHTATLPKSTPTTRTS
jgi:hypothetical protein